MRVNADIVLPVVFCLSNKVIFLSSLLLAVTQLILYSNHCQGNQYVSLISPRYFDCLAQTVPPLDQVQGLTCPIGYWSVISLPETHMIFNKVILALPGQVEVTAIT